MTHEDPSTMSARRPVIGITAYPRSGTPPGFAVPCGYVDAVRRAGGTPVCLPPGDSEPAHYLDLVDGVILAGGGDIDPEAYGGSRHESIYSVCAERDAFELRLIRAILARPECPVLCICRGLQVLNVASGGDLHAHIPETVANPILHRHPGRTPVTHPVTVAPESRLAAILGTTRVDVRSWHHQAIREIGRDLGAVAWTEDDVIEGVEHLTHPWCFAVQWHPEMQTDDPVQQRLFAALVTEATRRRQVPACVESRAHDGAARVARRQLLPA
jgi:putative glutamine amidotransferase